MFMGRVVLCWWFGVVVWWIGVVLCWFSFCCCFVLFGCGVLDVWCWWCCLGRCGRWVFSWFGLVGSLGVVWYFLWLLCGW